MPRWTPGNFVVGEVPNEILNKAPNKGGRPVGAADKVDTGNRLKPYRSRQTEKAKVVAKAAKWHVDNHVQDVSETVAKFFPEYSDGMTESDRYFRSRLAEEILNISQ